MNIREIYRITCKVNIKSKCQKEQLNFFSNKYLMQYIIVISRTLFTVI